MRTDQRKRRVALAVLAVAVATVAVLWVTGTNDGAGIGILAGDVEAVADANDVSTEDPLKQVTECEERSGRLSPMYVRMNAAHVQDATEFFGNAEAALRSRGFTSFEHVGPVEMVAVASDRQVQVLLGPNSVQVTSEFGVAACG